MFKRLCAVLLILALVFSLSGCSLTGGEDSLLKPPRPVGDLFDIQKALENSVSEKYTLKFPTSGENRSAIQQYDINGDGVNEALAFYSTVADNIVTMHINLITKTGDNWRSVGDFRCIATGVDTVDFEDINGDGIKEILIGWSIYGAVDKTLGVYSYAKNQFSQRVMEGFTHYMCVDIDGDNKKELFISHLDSKNEVASAKLLRFTDTGVTELGNCTLDSTATAYYKPILGKLSNGNTAIYFDTVKGNGLATEVFEIRDSVMTNALKTKDGTAISTFRPSNIEIRDLNKDGVFEIPNPILITQTPGVDNENIYITEWYTLKNEKMELSLSALMNYVDGYYIVVPQKWQGKIAVTRDTPNRIRTIMALDKKTGNSAETLVKVQTVPIDQKQNEGAVKLENAIEITRNGEFCYMAAVSETNGDTSVTLDEFKNMFKLLD